LGSLFFCQIFQKNPRLIVGQNCIPYGLESRPTEVIRTGIFLGKMTEKEAAKNFDKYGQST